MNTRSKLYFIGLITTNIVMTILFVWAVISGIAAEGPPNVVLLVMIVVIDVALSIWLGLKGSEHKE